NTTTAFSSNAFQADGDGLFDILFTFPNAAANRFTSGSLIYYIGGNVSLTDTSFNELSSPAGGAGPFHSAAHLARFGTASCSGWVGDSAAGGSNGTLNGACGTPVPEPHYTGLALAGGLLAFAGLVRRRRLVTT